MIILIKQSLHHSPDDPGAVLNETIATVSLSTAPGHCPGMC